MPSFSHNQQGFAPLAIVLLLLAGLTAGIVLVQQRTTFLPQAAVQEPAHVMKQDPKLGIRVTESKMLNNVYSLGVTKLRVSVESADFFLNDTEIQKANFQFAGQIFRYARNSDLQLVITIKPASPVKTIDLQNRIAEMAESIGSYQNLVFELGNEPNANTPNGQPFWTGTNEQYADFIKDATTAVKTHWPNAPIIIGALDLQGAINGGGEETAKAQLSNYFDSLNQKVNLNNYHYAIHSYHTKDWFEKIYALQKAEMQKRNLNNKIWLTETGVNINHGDNPNELVEIIKAAKSKNDIEGILIHAWDSSEGFQLWDSKTNGTTPIYSAVKSYIQDNPESITANPSRSSTPSNTSAPINAADKTCSNNPVPPPDQRYTWHAFCKAEEYATNQFSCASNADCPQNNVQGDSGVDAMTSNQCVQFKEGSRCIQLRLSTDYNPNDPAFETPNDTYINNPENIPFGEVGLGQSPGKEGDNPGHRTDFTFFLSDYAKKIARIKEDQRVKELLSQAEVDKQAELLTTAEQATKDAQDANNAWLQDKSNPELAKKASDATKAAADAVAAAEAIRKLAKLEQMLKGETTEQCVKADLGIRPWLLAPRLKARGEDTREDGSPGDKINRDLRLYVCSGKDSKLKWRVATEGNDNTQSDANQNSMERILGLHGDSEDAPYPTPKYPFTGIAGGYTTLVGQNPDEIRFALDKYIQTAKSGKTVVE